MLILDNRQFNNFAFTAKRVKKHDFGPKIPDGFKSQDRCELTNSQEILEYLEHWKIEDGRIYYIDKISKFIKGSKVFLNERIKSIIGHGGTTTVFDIGEGRALKISKENPFEYRKYNPRFDIPLLSQVYEYNGMYGYIQAIADTNTTLEDVTSVKKRMKRAGFIPSCDFSDRRTDQVGRYKGESYLLDSRCAVRQNDLKTRFADWFYEHYYMGKIICTPNEIDFSSFEHVNEAPRPNYTWRETASIIKKVVKSWVK